jgi:putative nucleotidyltransferase with HDIG domain
LYFWRGAEISAPFCRHFCAHRRAERATLRGMLKKIAVSELKLGMHLHELCGAWLEHPFWKSKFVLKDPDDLVKLRGSGVTHCVIDTSKGLDLDIAAVPAPAARGEPGAQATTDAPAAPLAASMQEELGQAATLLNKSREAVLSMFNEARMGRALDAKGFAPLVEEIAASVWRNPNAMVSLARLKSFDDYTYMHSVAVCALMVALARQLGQSEAQARSAGFAGLLHDIGKASMPLEVLNKPGRLTGEEYQLMQTHPARGHEFLRQSGVAGEVELDVCLHHHERPDGRGYPHALAEANLSLPARMGAVCDVYDAITSNRPYKSGWDPAESIAQMADWTKKGQFDATVFQAFAKSLGIYPVGSLVRLQSGRLGVVVEQHPKSLLAPHVKVFFSTRSQLHIPPEVVDLGAPGTSERIVGRESNEKWQFKHIDELWAGVEALQKIGRAC